MSKTIVLDYFDGHIREFFVEFVKDLIVNHKNDLIVFNRDFFRELSQNVRKNSFYYSIMLDWMTLSTIYNPDTTLRSPFCVYLCKEQQAYSKNLYVLTYLKVQDSMDIYEYIAPKNFEDTYELEFYNVTIK